MNEENTKQLAKRSAELVKDPTRGLISSKVGTYHPTITVELVKKYGGKVVTVRDIAKVQFGRISNPGIERCRKMMSTCVNMLLKEGIPVIPFFEEEGHHKVMGIKWLTYDDLTEDDLKRLAKFKSTAVTTREFGREKARLIMEQARKVERAWGRKHSATNGE